MTALSLTAANLDGTLVAAWDTGCLAGVALTAGQAVYIDANRVIQLCAPTTLITSSCIGLVANAAVSAGQPVFVWIDGTVVTAFPTLVIPVPYFVGASGGLIPIADLAQNDFCTFVGRPQSTTSFKIKIDITGLQKA
jgi:hypothetical protein